MVLPACTESLQLCSVIGACLPEVCQNSAAQRVFLLMSSMYLLIVTLSGPAPDKLGPVSEVGIYLQATD